MTVICREVPLLPDEKAKRLPVDTYDHAAGGGSLELTYVHQAALARLAIESGASYANKLCDGLSSLRMRRLVGHHLLSHVLSEPGSADYTFRVAEAAKEVDIIDGGKQDLRWLSQMQGVSEVNGEVRHYPLLAPQNKLVNSCYDDGFYTLAQTEAASDWMYADEEPFLDLLPAIARGDGPRFLTVVRGGEYAAGAFDTPEFAPIPNRIILAETVYLKPSIRDDDSAYVTLPVAVEEPLSSKEISEIEADSREWYMGVTLNRIDARVAELRREMSVARWIGRGAYAQALQTRADLLAGSSAPLKKVFTMRHFSVRSSEE